MEIHPANPTPPPGLTLRDVWFVLFRHKWKILLISSLGVIAAAGVFLFTPPIFESDAKLFIKYVQELKTPTQTANDTRIKSPDLRGENVINTELDILTSLDLAQTVADSIGPERILGKGRGTNRYAAAVTVQKGLTAEVAKMSSVIHVQFQHRDPELVQPVLNEVVEAYLKKHAEIHGTPGTFDEFLTQQTDTLRSRLSATEDALRSAMTNAGLISLEDSKKIYSERMSKIQQALLDAEAELAERQAAAAEMSKISRGALDGRNAGLLGTNAPPPTGTTNLVVSPTNSEPSTAVASTHPTSSPAAVAPEKLAEYKRILGLLETLTKRQQDLLIQYTPENVLVKNVQEQISENEKRKATLETENPELLAPKAPEVRSPQLAATTEAASTVKPDLAIATEMARAVALQSKIKVLTAQLEQIRKEANVMSSAEGIITDLQRKKELEESQYRYFQNSLEQSRIDEQLSAGRISNIGRIQAPSPPFRAKSKLPKIVAMIALAGIAGGFGLAFVLEFYLDPTLKRPIEIETKLRLPLFISIPRISFNGNGHTNGKDRGTLKGVRVVPLLSAHTNEPAREGEVARESAPLPSPSGGATSLGAEAGRLEGIPDVPGTRDAEGLPEIGGAISPTAENATRQNRRSGPFDSASPWHPEHKLRPFYEALRDRLITYFEVNNLTHKPKLVTVTSCTERSGVSMIAAGLAASLSETGDGNVLLVDMHEKGAAQQFTRGDLRVSLDQALELENRTEALVQGNLYVVKENPNGTKLPQALPKRFSHLVPRMRSSDYDYIIFDMPAITQISVTPRLARFMDMVLVVVEAERTDKDVVKRATSLLLESKANLGIVLNKTRSYVPKQLLQEI